MKKVVLPLLVLALAIGAMVFLFSLRPPPPSQPLERVPVPVLFMETEGEALRLQVETQGFVQPARTARLAAEVGGRVIERAPNAEVGDFVEEGEVLIRIDPRDYEAAVAEAEAALRSAEAELLRAEADADQAEADLRETGVEDPSPLARRLPQLEAARVGVDSAKAGLQLARTNLARTRLRAPFDAQVESVSVEVGDVVAGRGGEVARVQSTGRAEILLPLSRRQLALLDLPASPAAIARPPEAKPRVHLTLGAEEDAAHAAGWIDRLAGTVDETTRLRNAVAILPDPLTLGGVDRVAFPFGSFVEARIEGRSLPRAFRLPAVALVGENRVRVVDADNRLREREVRVVQRRGREVVVTEGLADGDRVCLTPLEIFVPGMEVAPEPAEDPFAVGQPGGAATGAAR